MLEPQSTLLFVALVVAFGLLIWRLMVGRRLALRIGAACLAFVVAMAFGVMAVNRYFDYYQTWGAAVADFGNANPGSGLAVSDKTLVTTGASAAASLDQGLQPRRVYLGLAERQGYTLQLHITGHRSHISRVVYVYLPPQYFQPRFRAYRFPVIELIHGQPGQPQDWINVVGIQITMDNLVRRRQASPAVLVMPDANGGDRISLQCLNQVHGPEDLTFLAEDVPSQVSRLLRVQPPGIGWGIAGYSEGGFCAANMALHFPHTYGFAASMSGYFRPLLNQLAKPARLVSPFAGNQKLKAENTPVDELRGLHAGAVIPRFWLGAGKAASADVSAAEYFWQLLQLHEANVPLVLTPGSGHTMTTWRVEVPPMLSWMTIGMAQALATAQQQPQHPAATHKAVARKATARIERS
ncbi:MAG TPA: alpha/beta hydrolase-fold protein [Streptosporangiaceae bacterium]|jgi:enterochelin esterase-like enzyme